MLPDQVSNPGPLTYESGALLTALRGPAKSLKCWSAPTGVKVHALINVYYSFIKHHAQTEKIANFLYFQSQIHTNRSRKFTLDP